MNFRKPTHTEAKATEQGWVSTKTGELLTSHRGLLSKLKDAGLNEFGNKPKSKPAPKKTTPKKTTPKRTTKTSTSKKTEEK